jgi:hypothetical protein
LWLCSAAEEQQQHAGSDDDDEEDVFQPQKGNVAFGSAADGWAFSLDQFAAMYSEKLGAKPQVSEEHHGGAPNILPVLNLVQQLLGSWLHGKPQTSCSSCCYKLACPATTAAFATEVLSLNAANY